MNPKATFYIHDYQNNKTEYQQIQTVLALIPEDAKEDILRNNAMRLFGDKLK